MAHRNSKINSTAGDYRVITMLFIRRNPAENRLTNDKKKTFLIIMLENEIVF